MGQVHKIWSGVSSSMPHSQVALGDGPHLCMDMLNLPTLVCKRLRCVVCMSTWLNPGQRVFVDVEGWGSGGAVELSLTPTCFSTFLSSIELY